VPKQPDVSRSCSSCAAPVPLLRRPDKMTDSKAATTNTALKPSPRSTAIAAALTDSLLPDLSRVVCAYARQLIHRFDAADALSAATVSPDGLSFELKTGTAPNTFGFVW
jgi:hypothetical protein